MRIALFAGAALLAGCQSMAPSGPSAKADLQPTKGNQASGTATFMQRGDKVRVVADVSGLNPGQEHGFPPERHAGDMPALKADANGSAHLDTVLAGSDDYKTQPIGNAGARVACGIIQRSS